MVNNMGKMNNIDIAINECIDNFATDLSDDLEKLFDVMRDDMEQTIMDQSHYMHKIMKKPQQWNDGVLYDGVWIVTYVCIDDFDFDDPLINNHTLYKSCDDAMSSIRNDINADTRELANDDSDYIANHLNENSDMNWRDIGTIEYPAYHYHDDNSDSHYYVVRLNVPKPDIPQQLTYGKQL